MTRIDEIRQRLDKASDDIGLMYRIPADEWEVTCDKGTSQLLTHARNDLAYLLDEVRHLAAQIEAVRKLHRKIPIYDTPIDECSEHDPDEHGIELDDGEIYCDQHVAYFACDECSSCTEDVLTEYPCPTIQALTKEN